MAANKKIHFDPNNNVVKLCIQGMELEGAGENEKAQKLFMQAWNKAVDDIDKFTAAHYVARQENTIANKLKWDELSLGLALKINDQTIRQSLPSLYLNVAKGYEDLNDFEKSMKNYQLALSFAGFLPENGYGKMIRAGIEAGLSRVNKS